MTHGECDWLLKGPVYGVYWRIPDTGKGSFRPHEHCWYQEVFLSGINFLRRQQHHPDTGVPRYRIYQYTSGVLDGVCDQFVIVRREWEEYDI